MDANNTNDLLSALIFIVGASHFDNYNLHTTTKLFGQREG
jgi:hypothetical protein